MSYTAGFRAGRAEVVAGWQGMVNELWAALGREPGTDAELVEAVRVLAAHPGAPDPSEPTGEEWRRAVAPSTERSRLPRTCREGCIWCEAAERVYGCVPLLEAAGRTPVADELLVLAELVGRKDLLGTRLAKLIVGEAS